MINEITGLRTGGFDFYHALYTALTTGKKEIFKNLAVKIGKSAKKDYPTLRNIFIHAAESEDKDYLAALDQAFPEVSFFFSPSFTFEGLAVSGIKPGINPEYQFPVSPQPFKSHECELYALKHLLKYKYNFSLDIPKWEKKMKKGPRDYWFFSECAGVVFSEGFDYEYYTDNKTDAGLFFFYLSRGEPVITERMFGKDRHSVVAYSWDANGVWLSDSGNGKRWVIPAQKLITNDIFTMRVIKKADSK